MVGPNGSGKSTLVRALLRRVPLQSGRVADRRHRHGGVCPNATLPVAWRSWCSARNPRSPCARANTSRSAARRTLARGASTRARLPPLARRRRWPACRTSLERHTDELSGGEWQRLRLARAIAQEAEAVVLDEPTTFLDIAHEMAAFELLADLARRGRAVIAVSHQLNLVSRFATHVVLLHRGVVAAAGTPDDVMRASVLESVYEWPLVVSRDPAVGAPTLVPLRRSSATTRITTLTSHIPHPTSMSSSTCRISAMLAVVAGSPCVALSQQTDSLPKVVITATRVDAATGAGISATSVIDHQDIERSGARDVAELLRQRARDFRATQRRDRVRSRPSSCAVVRTTTCASSSMACR